LVAGAGNPGAANVWRLAGPRLGLLVFALDAGKSGVGALLGLAIGGWWAGCAGAVGAMAGHAWPPWTRFRGGRAVACLVGGAVVLAPAPGAVAVVIFLVLLPIAGFARGAAAGLLAYPPLFALMVPDRRQLVGLGFAYLVLLLARLVQVLYRIRP
jgi:glycerol-3-phosphate acyltransferase PlsY